MHVGWVFSALSAPCPISTVSVIVSASLKMKVDLATGCLRRNGTDLVVSSDVNLVSSADNQFQNVPL